MKHLLLALALALPLASRGQSAGDYLFQKKSSSGPLAAVWVTPGAPPALFGTITGGNASSFTLGSGLALSGSTLSATGGAWGSITGTLADQTDLQTALDAKLATATAASTYASLSGSYANPAWITALAWSKLSNIPAPLTAFGALADAAGVLTNNGSGTLSYTSTSNGGNGASDSGKLATFDSGGVLRVTSADGLSAGLIVQASTSASNLLSLTSASLVKTFDALKFTTVQFATPSGSGVQSRTITVPATTGTLITTGDTGTVTNTMLAGSIALSKLATTGTANSTTFLRGDGAWAAIDLSGYLPLAGGTMTGVLTVPGVNLSSGSSGVTNGLVSNAGVTLEFWQGGGTALGFYTANREYYMPADIVMGWGSANYSSGSYGASRDLYLARDAAARLQLGRDHASTTTNQSIKAHDVTTGTGAALDLRGGNGSVAGGSVTISTSATTTPAVRMTVKASGVINMSGMPTSSAGLSSGDLWNNSGVVNIVP